MSEGAVRTASSAILGRAGYSSRVGHSKRPPKESTTAGVQGLDAVVFVYLSRS